jgi:hypothetical protein
MLRSARFRKNPTSNPASSSFCARGAGWAATRASRREPALPVLRREQLVAPAADEVVAAAVEAGRQVHAGLRPRLPVRRAQLAVAEEAARVEPVGEHVRRLRAGEPVAPVVLAERREAVVAQRERQEQVARERLLGLREVRLAADERAEVGEFALSGVVSTALGSVYSRSTISCWPSTWFCW